MKPQSQSFVVFQQIGKEGLFIVESNNAQKHLRGLISKKEIKDVLEMTKELGYIKDINETYKIGKEGYTNKGQFHPPYLITFDDDTSWALFTTTSIRERIKSHCWDSLNLKELNTNIERAYIVYPDSIKDEEKQKAISKNDKIISKHEYSSVEGIISQEQLYILIEEYGLRNKSAGQKKDKKGNSFETRIAGILKNKYNLEKWKTNNSVIDGIHYNIFEKIVNYLQLERNKVISIDATSDKKIIGLLPSKGPVKTDVLMTIKYESGLTKNFTISCKRSQSKAVTVHEYKAEDFSRVLDPKNQKLKSLLESFQKVGAIKYMDDKDIEDLTKEISPYNDKLAKWVLGGIGGEGNPNTQWAQYMLTYDDNDSEIAIHTIDEYCELLRENNIKGMFGTYFSWSYASGKKTKSIQLKCKIIK